MASAYVNARACAAMCDTRGYSNLQPGGIAVFVHSMLSNVLWASECRSIVSLTSMVILGRRRDMLTVRDPATTYMVCGCEALVFVSYIPPARFGYWLYKVAQNYGKQFLGIKFLLLTFQFVVILHWKRDLSSLPEAGEAAVQIS